MFATLVLVTGLVAVGSVAWPESRFRPAAATVVCLGAGYMVYSDRINMVVRKSWAYAEVMPTLPELGTVLSPVLQLLIVPVAALWTAARLGTSRELGPRGAKPSHR